MGKFFQGLFDRKPIAKKILFVSSTTSSSDNGDTFDYFASLISELAVKIQNRYKDFDFVIRVPERGEKASDEQIRFVEEAIELSDPFECIIISPVDRDEIYKHLENWIKKYGNRLIFIDQGFATNEFPHFLEDDVARPPYVQANWFQGGEMAGISMKKLFDERAIKCPHIVLVKGKIGSPERIKGFESAMEKNSGSDFQPMYHNCEGHYSKKSARESFEPYLTHCISEKRAIDGIFATNDEMALGVRDALAKHKDNYISAFSPPINGRVQLPAVIGFDGIRDLTFHIDNYDDFVYDTVNVRLKEQIESLSIIIDRTIKKVKMTEEEKFVEMHCFSYRDIKGI